VSRVYDFGLQSQQETSNRLDSGFRTGDFPEFENFYKNFGKFRSLHEPLHAGLPSRTIGWIVCSATIGGAGVS
jgi:hypothetical protein